MKTVVGTITVILLLSILGISLLAVIGPTTENENTASFEQIPLSDNEIKTRWPDLPTAEELWNSEFKFFIDTRSFGKQVIDPQFGENAVAETKINWEIMNYTSDVPNYHTGGIMYDLPHIWLQYNETIWIQVPPNRLG